MIGLIWQPGMTLESVEKEVILQAIRYFRGNKTATSTALGISVRTIDGKLAKYAEDGESKRKAEDERKRTQDEFLWRQRYGTKPRETAGSYIASGNHVEATATNPQVDKPKSVSSSKRNGVEPFT